MDGVERITRFIIQVHISLPIPAEFPLREGVRQSILPATRRRAI